jgi:hypothetical protein
MIKFSFSHSKQDVSIFGNILRFHVVVRCVQHKNDKESKEIKKLSHHMEERKRYEIFFHMPTYTQNLKLKDINLDFHKFFPFSASISFACLCSFDD